MGDGCRRRTCACQPTSPGIFCKRETGAETSGTRCGKLYGRGNPRNPSWERGPGYTAVDSANALLDKYGTLSALMNRSLDEIAGIRGIKAARAIRLAAAYERCQRLLKEIDRDA